MQLFLLLLQVLGRLYRFSFLRPSMEFLAVNNISKQKEAQRVLSPTSFSMQKGTKLAVAGATGSGKSTLLKIIGGLEQPDGGTVMFEGKRVLGPDEKLLPGHPDIGYLSQHFELRNNYTVGEELEYANESTQAEADAIYKICDISHLLHRGTNQISGGEKQRIVTARLLTTRPRLLLLDEPYSNLDVEHRRQMKSIIRNISEQMGISCILVSHEPMDTLSWADEILVLQNGLLVQQGTPQQVYHQPVNEYVAGLFGNYALLTPAQAQLFGIKEVRENKKMLVRPDYFSLNTNGSEGLAGVVTQTAFMGSHSEVTVTMPQLQVTSVAFNSEIRKGDHVFVSFSKQNNWWL